MVTTVRSKLKRIPGKLCYFQKEDFIRHKLMEYYKAPEESVDLEELKDKVVAILKKESFIFFDNIEYKAVFKTGKLVEFAVNFHHIL